MATLSERMNLKQATLLLVEPNGQNMAILSQVLMGFGAKTFHRCETIDSAKLLLERTEVDLIIAEGQAADGSPDGFDFVHWLRRTNLEPNAFAPVILTSTHTTMANVTLARDCGAHFIVAKPLIPTVLFDRILWVARVNRSFVTSDVYVGPDRRFKNVGPPDGTEGRRATDLKGEVGLAVEPNMSQGDIDSLIQPTRVAL